MENAALPPKDGQPIISVTEQVADIISILIHEIKNPIGAVFSNLSLIRDMLKSGPIDKDLLREIMTDLSTCESVYKDIINRIELTVIGNGVIIRPLKEELVSISKLFAKIYAIFYPTIKTKQIAFIATAHLEVPPILYGDATYILQIIINLVSNAMKFTASGGRISVFFSPHPEQSGYYILEVTDTGIGIPSDQLDRIFQKGVQLQQPADTEGRGIGLTIVERLVKMMDGSITVISQLAKGTTFLVTLPLSTFIKK